MQSLLRFSQSLSFLWTHVAMNSAKSDLSWFFAKDGTLCVGLVVRTRRKSGSKGGSNHDARTTRPIHTQKNQRTVQITTVATRDPLMKDVVV